MLRRVLGFCCSAGFSREMGEKKEKWDESAFAQTAIYLRRAGAELFKSVYFIKLNNWQK